MSFALCIVAALAGCTTAVPTTLEFTVWPQPAQIDGVMEARPFLSGSPTAPFAIEVSSTKPLSSLAHSRLDAAQTKYATIATNLGAAAAAGATTTNAALKVAVEKLVIVVEDNSDFLGIATKYNYTLSIEADGKHAVARAASIYGAMYAMETFVQLIDPTSGHLLVSSVAITDSPSYQWRGLMLDAGRRFFTVPLVKNLLDTMAGAKLNVLHLHASDMCRFGVESKLYPNLTDALTGEKGGFYTQDDVKDLIAYAGNLGIRVVPEFDFPGHSRGYIPLEGHGVEFCAPTTDTRSQLFGDPAGSTYGVVHDLLREMAGLFTDEVFNIGCDETAVKDRCTQDSTFKVERRVLQAIETEFNKTAEGWEEVLFDAGAATNRTIVNAWARHTAAEITATGRRAVESKAGAFYFTGAAPGGPTGWSKCWYDISTNVPANQMDLLLGGEMSMWTDSYCDVDQCGASTGGLPVGHTLFAPDADDAFGHSIGGMIWPRGFVGAAAFWKYDAKTDPSSAEFVAGIYKLSDSLAARGSYVCPTNCSCNQLTACGKPYLQPQPPSVGDAVGLNSCDPTFANSGQQFNISDDGSISLRNFPSMCLMFPGTKVYPLVLGKCAGNTWKHPGNGEIVHIPSGACMDADHTKHTIGTWECGQGQPNQHFSYDDASGLITSLDDADGVGGFCFTVNPVPPGPDTVYRGGVQDLV